MKTISKMNTYETALRTNIDNMLDEEVANACIRSGNDDLAFLGRELQEVVDAEKSGSEIRERIKTQLDA